MGDVVIVGPVSWNRIVYLDRLPEPRPHTQFATDHYETLGGTSAGKALHLAGLGRSVRLHTVIGSDAAAGRVSRALARTPIDVRAARVPGPTEQHLNLMTRAGERVSIYLETAEAAGVEPSERFAAADAAVIDLSELGRRALETARSARATIWVDLHDYDGSASFHHPFVDSADYLFLNADGMGDPVPFMRGRIAAGARAVVCTLGSRGAIALDRGGVLHETAAAPCRVVDTNGAGDAFFAGFLHASLGGADVAAALAAGARQATVALGTAHLHPALEDRPISRA